MPAASGRRRRGCRRPAESFPRSCCYLRRRGHREVERRTTSRLGLGADLAAVPAYDPLDDREPDAVAFELRGGMQPLKGDEQLVRVLRVESGAVVAYEKCLLPAAIEPADLDRGDRD